MDTVSSTKRLFLLLMLLTEANIKGCSQDASSHATQQLNRGHEYNIDDVKNFVSAPKFPNDATIPAFVSVTMFVALVSLFCNALIIHVVRVNQHMHSTTNYFIVNMACGDLLATVISTSISVRQLYKGSEWKPGTSSQATCRLMYYVVSVAMLCSIFSLVAITVDRFLAVSRPLVYKHRSSWSKIVIPIVWVVSMVIPSKLTLNEVEVRNDVLPNNKTYCVILDGQNDGIFVTCVGYFLPDFAMLILYTLIAYKLWTRRIPGNEQDAQRYLQAHQTAKKVIRMIICVMIIFHVCWIPLFLMFYSFYYFPSFYKYHNYYVPPIVTILGITNGPLNALIFAIFCEKFRLAFKRVFEKIIPIKDRILGRFGQGKISNEPPTTDK